MVRWLGLWCFLCRWGRFSPWSGNPKLWGVAKMNKTKNKLPPEADRLVGGSSQIVLLARVTSYKGNDPVQAIQNFQEEEDPFVSQSIASPFPEESLLDVFENVRIFWRLRIYSARVGLCESLYSDSSPAQSHLQQTVSRALNKQTRGLPQHPAVLGYQETQNQLKINELDKEICAPELSLYPKSPKKFTTQRPFVWDRMKISRKTWSKIVVVQLLIMSDSLWPLGLQLARLPCPSLSPRLCSNSCPLSRWCHPTVSASVPPLALNLSQH